MPDPEYCVWQMGLELALYRLRYGDVNKHPDLQEALVAIEHARQTLSANGHSALWPAFLAYLDGVAGHKGWFDMDELIADFVAERAAGEPDHA